MAEASTYAGKSLGEALQELRRGTGVQVVFSEALVRPGMRVTAEPEGSTPREVLAALLRPHGLRPHEGPDGALLVVPAVLGRRPHPYRPAGGLWSGGTSFRAVSVGHPLENIS